MIGVGEIEANLSAVRERIARAAAAAGRNPEDIQLVVVTKGHPFEVVEQVVAAGIRVLGESYAEEGVQKMGILDSDVEWHMIGHVQSRKARLVAEHYDCVHSLDRLKLARRLDKFAEESQRRIPVLLEVNVSGEASKYGWAATNEKDQAALLADAETMLAMPHLQIRGLMTIAPLVENPQDARPYFALARELRKGLARRFPEAEWYELSMGMSGDFEAAILEGATIVRVGSAILGPRPTQ